MTRNVLKIFVVALAFLFTSLAELSFYSDYYYAASSAAFVVTACFSIYFAVKTKSKLLIYYASIYIVGSFLYALMLYSRLSLGVYGIIYEGALNFGLLVFLADLLIICVGGINVIYRFYTLCRYGSSSDDIFDARVGLHKWAR